MTSLVRVRKALTSSGTENATLLTSLIDSGELAPYSWKGKDALKRRIGLKGPDEANFATLGKKQAPVGLLKTFTAKELQEICLRDLLEAREYYGERIPYFLPSDTVDESEGDNEEVAGMRVINGLVGASDDATGVIVSFPSETLEEICSKGSITPANVLRTAMATCTVLPTDTLLPLQHNNESTTVTTLLSGSVAWIIWPPLEHNIRTLQTAYEEYAQDYDEAKMDVSSTLEGGQIFVQPVSEGLRIPPFCLMMSLALETSVLATTSHVTVENFIAMLQKLPLLKAWHQTEANGDRKLSDFNASILRYLDFMLNGDDGHEDRNALKLPRTKGGLLDSLFEVWDSVKDDLAAMMGPADSKAMETIWEDFLVDVPGRECRMCHMSIRNKQKLMKKHFVDEHWVEAKANGRDDSRKAAQGSRKGKESAEQAEETIVIDGEDAMDVDK